MNRTFSTTTIALILFISLVLTNTLSTDDEDYDDFDDDDLANVNSTSTNSTLIFTIKLSNMTKDPGKLAKMVCEVQNLDNSTRDVKFIWKINEVQVSQEPNYKIRTTKESDNRYRTTLRIPKLNQFDQGFFECIASNGVSKTKSEAYLTVTPEFSKWSKSDINTIKTDYSSTNSFSVGAGGEITTYQPMSKSETNDYTSTITKPKTFSPNIEFEVSPSGKLTDSYPIYNNSEPFCQLYRGETCKNFLSEKYVFVEPPYTQMEVEEKLYKAFMVISQSNDISSGCSKFAFPSLCYSAFPVCSNPMQINRFQTNHLTELRSITDDNRHKFKDYRTRLSQHLKRICKEDCLVLETELCSKEYAIAKRHPVLSQTIQLEECDKLPNETDINIDECLSLGVGDLNVNPDDKCYWDKGKLYSGVQDTTINNNKCLRWSHQFQIQISHHSELSGHNYCRNPGEIEEEPFCYVEQNRRELCGIKKCVYIFGIYVVLIILAIIALIISISTYCYCRRKNKLARNLQNKDLPTVNKNIYGNPGPSSPVEMNTLLPQNMPPQRNHHSNKNSLQTVPQYTYKEVRFIEELGEGAFGKVYKGELKTKTTKMFVAIKSLKEGASAKTQADFQREIELISELRHPNIICLLGVVMKQEPMCMLFEYMSEGDLHEFLIANSPGEGKSLTHDQFLHIAIQIAQGMEYLSSNHYVHRDLAARNCLVSKDLVVKISDFGLSRDMYSCDYYRVQSKSLLPVRWMPPESILYGKFTTESDVWSYGIVLWEVYSYGLQPYYGYNNQEVINMIRARKLLPCPDACPSYCYALMVECWAEQPIRRPQFSEVSHRLKVWKQSESMNGAYFRTPSNQPTPQKYGHSSKSSHTSDSQTLCPAQENHQQPPTFTWDRNKPSSSKLHDSQNSLTSRSSSMGNTTQSTTVSLEHKREKRPRRNVDSIERLNPKNIVVNSNGENFETKLSQ